MARNLRSRNLDLIRWLNHGHEHTANKLAVVTNSNYLSRMATGDMEISDEMASQIESTLNLPSGWLDRDNVGLINICALDFDIQRLVGGYSVEAKKGLLAFISAQSK